MSGSSEAWYRARFGTERSRVQIPPSRPFTFTGSVVATTAARTDPTILDIRRAARRNINNRSEERPVQEYRGTANCERVLRVLSAFSLWTSPEVPRRPRTIRIRMRSDADSLDSAPPAVYIPVSN